MTVKELLVVGNLSRGIEGEPLRSSVNRGKWEKVRTPDTLNDMNMGELCSCNQSVRRRKR